MSSIPALEGGSPVRKKPIEAWPRFTEYEINLVLEVLKSGRLSSLNGTVTRKFEEEFAKFIGAKYSIATSNGTTALHTALASIGIGPGDEVITTPFTFVATATSILHQNAIPIFADISLKDYNIDPTSIEEKISDRTKAIIVVHLAGNPAEMDQIMKIAHKHGLKVIEDCAQAIGSRYRGKTVGNIGDVGTFSFYQSKNMTTGEGGMVVTNDELIAEKARLVINHGQTGQYFYEILGYNYRMTELQAALGLGQLKRLNELNNRRREIAKIYSEELADLEELILPYEKNYTYHTWHIYQVMLKLENLRVDRDHIVKALKRENVLVLVAYPKVIYQTPLFQKMIGYGKGCPWSCPYYNKKVTYHNGLCPNAEYVAERIITLPTFSSLSDDDVLDITKAIKKVINYYKK